MSAVRRKRFRTGKDSDLTIMRALSCSRATASAFLPMLMLTLGVGQASRCYAQTQAHPPAQATEAAVHEPYVSATEHDGAKTANAAPSVPTVAPDPDISPAVAKQLATMQAEIEELKAELKGRTSATNVAAPAPAPAAAPVASPEPKPVELASVSTTAEAAQVRSGLAEKPKPAEPFAYADWTWLNGNPRNKDVVWDSKFFTPEIRMDVHYIQDLNHPRDDSMGGSTRSE